jgi:hypothetical protein
MAHKFMPPIYIYANDAFCNLLRYPLVRLLGTVIMILERTTLISPALTSAERDLGVPCDQVLDAVGGQSS